MKTRPQLPPAGHSPESAWPGQPRQRQNKATRQLIPAKPALPVINAFALAAGFQTGHRYRWNSRWADPLAPQSPDEYRQPRCPCPSPEHWPESPPDAERHHDVPAVGRM